jgi:hypothetical protein
VRSATGALAEALARADEAYRAAEASDNVNGMVAATKLKAELSGVLEAPPPLADVDPSLLTDADLARIVSTCTCGALHGRKPDADATAPLGAWGGRIG